MGILDGFRSLAKKVNRATSQEPETQEGALDLLDELTLETNDETLIDLKNDWLKKWNEYSPEIQAQQDENEKYWLGKHFDKNKIEETDRAVIDNIIFEAVETFLPISTKQNPEPIVRGDNSEEGNTIAKDIQAGLVYQADIQNVKLKLKKATRFWALYLLGVMKISWDVDRDDIHTETLRPQRLILDPDGTITEDMEYDGEYIGEYKDDTASSLILKFPKREKLIKEEVSNKMGTKITYIEWWTNEYQFWTLHDDVLGKIKNPHYNYPEDKKTVDDFGKETMQEEQGKNHFPMPKMPYVFLSIFNLGKHPHDDTSLIGQNLANQDIINKRQAQIDKNVDGMNGGYIISGERSGLTQEQATVAMEAVRQGDALWLAQGDPNTAVNKTQGTAMPPDVFNHLVDTRNELRNIFGVRGSSPQGTISEETVGGKVLIKEQDSSRIGGGISGHLEQFTDKIYNWWVQMMYVYYDESHLVSTIGTDKTESFIELTNDQFPDSQLLVSVKEGSLLPKDELVQANQAIEMSRAGLIDPLSLFEKLDFPDSQKSTERLYLWNTAPELLIEDAAKAAEIINQDKKVEDAATDMTIQEQAEIGRQAVAPESLPPQKK